MHNHIKSIGVSEGRHPCHACNAWHHSKISDCGQHTISTRVLWSILIRQETTWRLLHPSIEVQYTPGVRRHIPRHSAPSDVSAAARWADTVAAQASMYTIYSQGRLHDWLRSYHRCVAISFSQYLNANFIIMQNGLLLSTTASNCKWQMLNFPLGCEWGLNSKYIPNPDTN